MDDVCYDMIFKRRSFHVFREIIPLEDYELAEIEAQIDCLIPLEKGIDVVFRIVRKEETTCKRGEYCILIYSEKKGNYLQNVGYMGEQLDLWLAWKDIGVCWYGVGKSDECSYNGLEFIIMLAIAKTDGKAFRKDYTKSKRKLLNEIWSGEGFEEIANVVRYAPSACNSQPWYIRFEENALSLYRVRGKRGIMPKDKVSFYNCIDVGIMMFFIETCLKHEGFSFSRELFPDPAQDEDMILNVKFGVGP